MESMEVLRSKLSPGNILKVETVFGDTVKFGFEWNEPALAEEIKLVKEKYSLVLPEGYEEFLQISNGAILFKDMENGTGCKILGINEMITETKRFKQYGIRDSWVMFGKWTDDKDILLFDMEKLVERDFYYIVCGVFEDSSYVWYYIEQFFGWWLSIFLEVQGNKYWRWCSIAPG